MDYLTQLEKIIQSEQRLIALESDNINRVCDVLLELSRLSDMPYYMANPQQAMFRLGAPHIGIPRTQTSFGLVEHIEASQHAGVFILRNQYAVLKNDVIVKRLVNIANDKTHKLIIFIAKEIDLPDELKPLVTHAKHEMKNTG